ncbi:hypothetical protein B0H63DRAFT_294187 [Podospora didyma]|uniref:Uncharacterized protein n=1 Tax=Podospora didyma TaxID=330526 RepID=A0AAE0N7L1_9PEZI|nr:hypothetical protein B0H63DRAFT_294187 [Podospora didyma]
MDHRRNTHFAGGARRLLRALSLSRPLYLQALVGTDLTHVGYSSSTGADDSPLELELAPWPSVGSASDLLRQSLKLSTTTTTAADNCDDNEENHGPELCDLYQSSTTRIPTRASRSVSPAPSSSRSSSSSCSTESLASTSESLSDARRVEAAPGRRARSRSSGRSQRSGDERRSRSPPTPTKDNCETLWRQYWD